MAKSASDIWKLFKGKLIKVRNQHAPVRGRDTGDKVREPCMTKETGNLDIKEGSRQ